MSKKGKGRQRAGHAANVGVGALSGGAIGAPLGALLGTTASAHDVVRKSSPPAELSGLKRIRWLRKHGPTAEELMQRLTRGMKRGAIGGGAAGILMGGLLGNQLARALKQKVQSKVEGAATQAPRSRVTPQSSAVRGYSYDPSSQALTVTFKSGQTYRYKDVPEEVHRALNRSKSVGTTIHKRVKAGGYEYEKIGKQLTARGRKQIKGKNFALPGGRYPIHDKAHARNALSRVAQHGTPEEQAQVRAAVAAKYPGIGKPKKMKKTAGPIAEGVKGLGRKLLRSRGSQATQIVGKRARVPRGTPSRGTPVYSGPELLPRGPQRTRSVAPLKKKRVPTEKPPVRRTMTPSMRTQIAATLKKEPWQADRLLKAHPDHVEEIKEVIRNVRKLRPRYSAAGAIERAFGTGTGLHKLGRRMANAHLTSTQRFVASRTPGGAQNVVGLMRKKRAAMEKLAPRRS